MNKTVYNILIFPVVLFVRAPLVFLHIGLLWATEGLDSLLSYIPGMRR